MTRLATLMKKREELDRQIQQAQAAQKRGERIAELAAEAGLLELKDDELRAAFQRIAAARKPTDQRAQEV